VCCVLMFSLMCVLSVVCGVYTSTYVFVRKHVRTSRRFEINGDRISRPKFGELERNSDENFAEINGPDPDFGGKNPGKLSEIRISGCA
jgi:hypothetical protein